MLKVGDAILYFTLAPAPPQWMSARGWTCYTSRGQTAGDPDDCLFVVFDDFC